MNFLPLKLAWQSLFAHKGRTILTILGIVIGIAAVIIVMSAGESIKKLILGEIEAYGTDFVEVEIKVPSTDKTSVGNAMGIGQGIQITTLKSGDLEAIGKLPSIKQAGGGVMGQGVISYLNKNQTLNYFGASNAVGEIMSLDVEKGRFYTDEEDRQLEKVVVLGSKVAEDLFGNQDPIGQSVKIGHLKFRVVGVLKEKGSGTGFDFDKMIYLPLATTQKIVMGVDYLMFIIAQMADANLQEQTAAELTALMRERHNITDPNDDDFAVTTAKEAMDMVNSILGGVTLLLVAIAAISLIVGGVGIMNIMYVSVTERTFEIGLRKSIGARKRQILWQFLWEAIAVTVFGGIIGIISGIFFAFFVSVVANQLGFVWTFALPLNSVLIAFGFCGLVGLVFGYYPANRAARMEPVAALRYE